jgi:SAM-dependent methyltransferase
VTVPLTRRATYEDANPRDSFIVTVLRDGVQQALHAHAASPRPGARALDVGCGGQPFRNDLEGLGYRYAGLDVEQNADGSVDHVGPIDGVLPASLGDGPAFDLVLCTEVLEHVSDWHSAFRNLASLLLPGGTLIITCPFFYPLHEQPIDYWRPTPHAMRLFGCAAGLSPVSATAAGDAWDVLGTLLGHTGIVAAQRRLPDRVLARGARLARSFVLSLLLRRVIQSRLNLVGDVYLSNICVYQRPRGCGA